MKKNFENSKERGNKRMDYTKLPLIDLISAVARKEEDQRTSDRALLELIARVNPFLRYKTHYFFSLNHIHSILEEQEVVSSITLTMYQDIRLLLEAIKKHTEEQHVQAMEEWLSKSIENLIGENEGKKKKEVKIVFNDIKTYSELADELDETHAEATRRRVQKLKGILKQACTRIPTKNYKILLTYYQHKEDRNSRKKLPSEILKKISSVHQVTKHYAAKIKRRSFDTLFDECHQLAGTKGKAAHLRKGKAKE